MCVRNGNRRNRGREMDGWAGGGHCWSQWYHLSLCVLCNTHDSCGAQRGWYHAHVLHPTHSHTYTAYQYQGDVSSNPQPTCSVYCICVCMCYFSVCASHNRAIHGCYTYNLQYKGVPKSSVSPCTKRQTLYWPCSWQLAHYEEQMCTRVFLFRTHDAPAPLRLPVNWWKRTDSSLDSTTRTIFNWLVLRWFMNCLV